VSNAYFYVRQESEADEAQPRHATSGMSRDGGIAKGSRAGVDVAAAGNRGAYRATLSLSSLATFVRRPTESNGLTT
jgi:hypothetical protein